jgi:cytochrome c-type biogenesis protein CcmH/NrfG
MDFWIIVLVIMFIAVVVLMYLLSKKSKEYIKLEKREERTWTLKVALEKTYHLPTVEAHELEKIEPEIRRIMKGSGSEAETEENLRRAVMALYEDKKGG